MAMYRYRKAMENRLRRRLHRSVRQVARQITAARAQVSDRPSNWDSEDWTSWEIYKYDGQTIAEIDELIHRLETLFGLLASKYPEMKPLTASHLAIEFGDMLLEADSSAYEQDYADLMADESIESVRSWHNGLRRQGLMAVKRDIYTEVSDNLYLLAERLSTIAKNLQFQQELFDGNAPGNHDLVAALTSTLQTIDDMAGDVESVADDVSAAGGL